MLVLGLVNMGCGLLRLYPTKSQSSAQWLVYFFLVALWVVVLGICEVRILRRTQRVPPSNYNTLSLLVALLQIQRSGTG